MAEHGGVTGDTLVSLAHGPRVPIRDLLEGSYEVWAVSGEVKLERSVARQIPQAPALNVLEVRLASGRTLRASSMHEVFGPRGWVKVADIEPGLRLGIARQIPQPARQKRWLEHELVLLGQLVGDGSYLKGCPLRYTTASEENSEAVRSAAQAMGSPVKRYSGRGLWHQLLISGNGNRWHAHGVGGWLKELGIHGQRSHQKRLPSEVFELANEQVVILLKHLWGTDGSISIRKPGARGGHGVYFSTCSPGLAADVAALLLRLGIVARTYQTVKGNYRPCYYVQVMGSTHQRIFLDAVGAFGPRAAPAAALRVLLDACDPNTNVDTLPNEAFVEIQASMEARGISRKEMAARRGTPYNGKAAYRFSPSRRLVEDYAHKLGDDGLLKWTRTDVFWDRVVAVESVGPQPVFSLSTSSNDSWLADSILCRTSEARSALGH